MTDTEFIAEVHARCGLLQAEYDAARAEYEATEALAVCWANREKDQPLPLGADRETWEINRVAMGRVSRAAARIMRINELVYILFPPEMEVAP